MTNRTTRDLILIAAVAAVMFFTSLGKARLWDRDEPRNAGCAAEMMHRGDLIVPIFNDELRHQKPVLLYWLMIAAYRVFGIQEFAARFPSAVLAVGSCLLTYGIARRLFRAEVALWSGLILCSSVMFAVAARAATPDSTLIFFGTLGIYFYVVGTFAPFDEQSNTIRLKRAACWFPAERAYAVLMYAAFGLGVLSKGPIGLVIPTAVIGAFLMMQRLPRSEVATEGNGNLARLARFVWALLNPLHFWRTCWSMRPLTGLLTVLLIAGPWYVAVAWQTGGEFTRQFFLNENFARAMTVMENHSGGWWYYPLAIAVGFFPWSIFLLPTIGAADRVLSGPGPLSPSIKLMACWVAVQVGSFSLADTKLPSYVTPCYPALSILTAFCLTTWIFPQSAIGKVWEFGAAATLGLAGLAITISIAVATGMYFPEIWWLSFLGLVPLLGAAATVWLLNRGLRNPAFSILAGTCLLFCWLLFAVGTVAVDSTSQTEIVLNEIRRADRSRPVAAYRCLESSWVYYSGRPVYELDRGQQRDQGATSLNRSADWEKKPIVAPEVFVATFPDALFVTTNNHADELIQRLPDNFQVLKSADFFLKRDQKLILIGPTIPSNTTAQAKPSESVR
jgi:4-amino-4-deoxy-L-arabinose transferase-like glycosyltransferase